MSDKLMEHINVLNDFNTDMAELAESIWLDGAQIAIFAYSKHKYFGQGQNLADINLYIFVHCVKTNVSCLYPPILDDNNYENTRL